MATRPAWALKDNRVIRYNFDFTWNGGFAVSQKQKNIKALHEAIDRQFHEQALEISTKSFDVLGKSMSAFTLKLDGVLLECVFQSGKVFANGGPYKDLLNVTPKEAKHDERLKTSGNLIAFEHNDVRWPLEPKTAFYDYLYVKAALAEFSDEVLRSLDAYTWFTDIEFNPNKSINSQARAVAILKAVIKDGAQQSLSSPEVWIAYHKSVVRQS